MQVPVLQSINYWIFGTEKKTSNILADDAETHNRGKGDFKRVVKGQVLYLTF